jgi:hypothetical protein
MRAANAPIATEATMVIDLAGEDEVPRAADKRSRGECRIRERLNVAVFVVGAINSRYIYR